MQPRCGSPPENQSMPSDPSSSKPSAPPSPPNSVIGPLTEAEQAQVVKAVNSHIKSGVLQIAPPKP